MVDETVEPDEKGADEVPETPKRAGRPSRAKAKPKSDDSEPVADSETSGDATDEPKPEAKESTQDSEEKPKADKGTAPEGRIVSEGEDVSVETEEVNGTRIATETVYREKRLPNSSRYTYVLVASKGTKVE